MAYLVSHLQRQRVNVQELDSIIRHQLLDSAVSLPRSYSNRDSKKISVFNLKNITDPSLPRE